MSMLLLAALAGAQAQRRSPKALKKALESQLPQTTVEQALAAYDFEAAEQLLEHEIATREKNRQSTTQLEAQLEQARRGRQMMNAVERVTVVDSMIVGRSQVLDYFRLNPECGALYRSADFFHNKDTRDCTVFKPQMGDQVIYAQAGKKGVLSLYSRDLFADGTMSEPVLLKGISDNNDSQNYPFRMTDGTTLYFAQQGAESLGGYDIFMSRYDADSRRYLAPENIGMPFNSPANDYLMAIDEVNNLGWFVTDRNMKADKVCIYIFIPNATRQVYIPEETKPEVLNTLARLGSIRATWTDKNLVQNAQKRLKGARDVNSLTQYTEFVFVLKGNQVYHHIDDFKNPMAQQIAKKWLENQSELEKTRGKLKEFRTAYHKATPEVQDEMAPAILQLEAIEEETVEFIKQQEKEMRIAEIGQENDK